MAGKTDGKKGKKDKKGKGDKSYVVDTVAVILKRDCAEALYAALVVALGTLPSPKKKKKKDKKKKKKDDKGKDTKERSRLPLELCAFAGVLLWLRRGSQPEFITSRSPTICSMNFCVCVHSRRAFAGN